MAWLSALALLVSAGASRRQAAPQARRCGLVGACLALETGLFTPHWWLGLTGLLLIGLASQPRATTRSLTFTQLLLAAGWLGAAGQPVLAGLAGWGLMYRFSPSRGLGLAGVLSTLLLALGFGLGQPPLVALGFAVRLGLVPFHSWLVTSFEKGPTAVAAAFFASGLVVVDLSGWPTLAAVGAPTMLLGAVLASAQPRLRRAVACLSLSQAGLLGLAFGWSPEALPTLVVWMALATITWALCAELVEVRYGQDPPLDRFSASFEAMPRLSTAFVFSGLVAVGLPGTLGYVAEDMVAQSLVHSHPLLAVAGLLASTLNAITVGRAVFHLFSGPLPKGPGCDLLPREMALLTLAFCVLAGLGFWPGGL